MIGRDTGALADGLRRYLPRGDRITGVKTLSAGHSNETYLVEGIDEILRMPPSAEGLLPPYDMARQHAVLSAVKANTRTVPLPAMLELCTDPSIGIFHQDAPCTGPWPGTPQPAEYPPTGTA